MAAREAGVTMIDDFAITGGGGGGDGAKSQDCDICDQRRRENPTRLEESAKEVGCGGESRRSGGQAFTLLTLLCI